MTALPTIAEQIGAALFYAISSLLVIFVNKIVLSTFEFPSSNFLALAQFLTTAIATWSLRLAGKVQIENLTLTSLRAVLPLTALFLLNVLCGLGGTQRVSLPMFTVLRRFSILMAMLLEQHLGMSRPSRAVQFGIMLMIVGALVAALSDLSFDSKGYSMILANDFFTAAYGISMKRAISGKSISKSGLLFYNSVFSSIVMMFFLSSPYSGEFEKIVSFPLWDGKNFVVLFFLASCMGSVLNYSIFVCTSVNSALTTTVVGCLKNVLTAYIGMVFGGGYIFNGLNFTGLNVSIGGSFVYSWAKYKENRENKGGNVTAGGALVEKVRRSESDSSTIPLKDAKEYV